MSEFISVADVCPTGFAREAAQAAEEILSRIFE